MKQQAQSPYEIIERLEFSVKTMAESKKQYTQSIEDIKSGLKELKLVMPRGGLIEIAKRLNVSRGLISAIFNGVDRTPRIGEVVKIAKEIIAEAVNKQQQQ